MSRPRRQQRRVSGIVLLDKPGGVTSNRALQQVKRLYAAAKAGHTGSLDPLATGMLPICLGEATKMSTYLLNAGKTYRVVCRLGVATDSGDADGTVTETREVPSIDAATLRNSLECFKGEITQTPPMHSALKHKGQPLYKLARQGVEVPRAARRITIHELTLETWDGSDFECLVSCSKGTYIRSLVIDIAAALGTVGHVISLHRQSVEPFPSAAMLTLDYLEQQRELGLEALDAVLLPCDAAVSVWPVLKLDAVAADKLRHGQRLIAAPSWPLGRVRIYGPHDVFLGLGDVLAEGHLAARRLIAY